MADGVEFDFDAVVSEVLMTFETRGQNLDRITPEVADALVSAVSDVIQAAGPDWAPFAASTVRSRGDTEAAQLLQDTGALAQSIIGESGPDWALATSSMPYTKYHATGTPTLPVRNPFDLGPFEAGVLDDVAELCLDEVVGG